MIVLDASLLIAHLDRTDPHHEEATALLSGLANQALAASSLTLAEVLVGPARTGRLDLALGALEALAVAPQPLAEDAHLRLALLRAETNLKLPDCCVLLAAEAARAAVASFDRRLCAAAAERGLTVLAGASETS